MVVALDRRLVAVMFTDMAGYTALLQADERLALDRRERYWDALERHHEAFGGTIVQRLGDGSMSMFPTSLAAVQAAVAVQQELAPQDVTQALGGQVVPRAHLARHGMVLIFGHRHTILPRHRRTEREPHAVGSPSRLGAGR